MRALANQRRYAAVDLVARLLPRQPRALRLTSNAKADGGIPKAPYLPPPGINVSNVRGAEIEGPQRRNSLAHSFIRRTACSSQVVEKLDQRMLGDILRGRRIDAQRAYISTDRGKRRPKIVVETELGSARLGL